jgi:hypothetical protein
MRTLIVAATAVVALVAPAAAQLKAPAAIVEEVKGNVPGVEFMDYVSPGKVIKLGTTGSIVLSYLASCLRETITGGVVLVGTEQSKVDPMANVETTKVDCAGQRLQLSDSEASESAATTFRSVGNKPPAPQTIYGVSPVFETAGPGKLVIERTDLSGTRDEVVLDNASLVKGRFYDMAKAGKSLMPGATYRAAFGSRSIDFKIAPLAKSGDAPIVGRLLRL